MEPGFDGALQYPESVVPSQGGYPPPHLGTTLSRRGTRKFVGALRALPPTGTTA